MTAQAAGQRCIVLCLLRILGARGNFIEQGCCQLIVPEQREQTGGGLQRGVLRRAARSVTACKFNRRRRTSIDGRADEERDIVLSSFRHRRDRRIQLTQLFERDKANADTPQG